MNIEVQSLSKICKKYVPKNVDIQFCKIDVEGNERNVLLGYDFVNYRPKIFCIEATEPGKTIPSHKEWEDILLKMIIHLAFIMMLINFIMIKELNI